MHVWQGMAYKLSLVYDITSSGTISYLAAAAAEPQPSTSADAGLYASVIVNNEEHLIPIRPEQPIEPR